MMTLNLVLHVALGLAFIGALRGVSTESSTSGTPRNLREIFIGRCMFYQEVVNPEPFKDGREKNCTSLWLKFSQAWVGKDPCQIPPNSYAAFVKEAYHDFRSYKACLWNNLYPFITNYAKQGERIIHISLTLSGYLGDQIVWCGSTKSVDGINYNNCSVDKTTCPEWAVRSFWKEVSVKYSASLNETVTIFLDGSGPKPSYDAKGIMGAYEIPQLEPTRVKMVDIIVLHAIGKSSRETCEKGSSIDMLKETLDQKQLKWQCRDNPPPVHHYLCIDQADDKMCKFASNINSSNCFIPISCYTLVGFMVLVHTILTNTCTYTF